MSSFNPLKLGREDLFWYIFWNRNFQPTIFWLAESLGNVALLGHHNANFGCGHKGSLRLMNSQDPCWVELRSTTNEFPALLNSRLVSNKEAKDVDILLPECEDIDF